MCQVAIGRHMSNSQISQILCIYAQSRFKFTVEKRYDCYRNTKIVGKMNPKRPDIERYRHLDACTQSERGEAGGREQMSVRDGAASQLPRT